MHNFIEERNGKLYIESECKIATKLYDYDFKRLLRLKEWELHSAICYLSGYDKFDEESFFENTPEGMIHALKRVNIFYTLAMGSISKGVLKMREDCSTIVKDGISKCYVTPYEILKWAVLNDILLPLQLQGQTGLFQDGPCCDQLFNVVNKIYVPYIDGRCEAEQKHPYFVEGSKFKNLSITERDRLTCQAIAQTIWYLFPGENKASIETRIKNSHFLNELGNASKYVGKHTFRRWLDVVDPRPDKERRGRPSTRKNKKLELDEVKPIKEVGYWTDHHYWEHALMRIYNFRKFKIIVITCASVLLHENPSLTPESVLSHPLIQIYSDSNYEFVKQLTLEWIHEAFSLSK